MAFIQFDIIDSITAPTVLNCLAYMHRACNVVNQTSVCTLIKEGIDERVCFLITLRAYTIFFGYGHYLYGGFNLNVRL